MSALQKHWPILAVVGSGLILWGTFQARLAANETAEQATATRVDRVERDLRDINASLSAVVAIQTEQAKAIDRIAEKIDRMAEELRK